MIKHFLCKYDLKNIWIKFEAIVVLNILDLILTFTAISRGYGIEANAVVAPIAGNLANMILFKGILPTVAVILVYQRMEAATEKQLIISNRLINILMIFYICVAITHLFWLIPVGYFVIIG